jgi:UDP-glucose 4-epimerase
VTIALEGGSALVTGGAGFIGSHLVDGLVQAGCERIVVLDNLWLGRRENLEQALGHAAVSFVEGDCADGGLLAEVAAQPFDLCFNLAVVPLPHSLEHPRENVERNVAMTAAICDLGRAGGFRRLVQFSSSEVYGTALTAPMSEAHAIVPHTPYAAAKAATDMIAHSYGTTFGLEVVVVRPFNTYGPRQNDGSYAGLLPAVVRRVEAGEPVVIHGDGEQTRDLTYVTDAVVGALRAGACDEAVNQTVNLGSGREASVMEQVRQILEAMDLSEHPVVHGPPRAGDVRRHLSDVTLARRLFGYEPQIALRDGIRETVSWYRRRPR